MKKQSIFINIFCFGKNKGFIKIYWVTNVVDHFVCLSAKILEMFLLPF